MKKLPNGSPQLVNVSQDLLDDPTAFEIMRVWAQHGEQVVVLRGLHTRDPAKWGVFLADLTRHLARQHHLTYGDDERTARSRIQSAFEVEMAHSTDEGSGHLLDE